jgi:hypothetical protein
MDDSSHDLTRLELASEASQRARAARAALGDHIPPEHPNRPGRWWAARQAVLTAADELVEQTTREVDEALDRTLSCRPRS